MPERHRRIRLALEWIKAHWRSFVWTAVSLLGLASMAGGMWLDRWEPFFLGAFLSLQVDLWALQRRIDAQRPADINLDVKKVAELADRVERYRAGNPDPRDADQ